MEGLQKTLLFFKEKSIEIKSSFFKRLLKLYEKRIERAKKTLFYYSLLVVCNPKHPIGYRFIMKEYNDLYESEALRIGK
jgi:hypothetical protein